MSIREQGRRGLARAAVHCGQSDGSIIGVNEQDNQYPACPSDGCVCQAETGKRRERERKTPPLPWHDP